MKKIKKRDGRVVPFDREKIRNAVLMAFEDVDEEATPEAETTATSIANYIEDLCNDISIPIDVETIQDTVEEQLMESNRKDVAKRYILYREKRSKARERNTRLMKAINEKLSATNVQNQNANMDEYSFGGRKGEADAELMRKIALDYVVSDMARENHLNNEIYIHDLDSYVVGMHNCLSVPLDDLLANGFVTRQTDVRPAQSINTAFQLVAVLFQIQSLQQFGKKLCRV